MDINGEQRLDTWSWVWEMVNLIESALKKGKSCTHIMG